jgi:hypothetical protein
VTLCYLLTRQHPFFAPGERDVAIEVLEERVRDEDWPTWDEASGIADDVREVLERMLRSDAFERPRAAPAADALRSILGDR